MDKSLIIILSSISALLSIAGMVLLWVYAGWQIALGVFLWTWGNNVGQRIL